LLFASAVHSFILDVEDELIVGHFTETELQEIDSTSIPEVPELSNEIDEFLGKFLGKVINISFICICLLQISHSSQVLSLLL